MKINYFIPRLPAKYCHGTVEQRQLKANELNSQIFERIVNQFGSSDRCYFLDIKKIIEEFLGDCTKIYFRSSKIFSRRGETKLLTKKYGVKGIKIRIPLDPYNDVNIRTIPILMHEIGHATLYLSNPKYIINNLKCFQGKFSKKKIWRFYNNHIYKRETAKTPEKKEQILQDIEKGLNKILKKYTPQERILYLNQLRYSIQSEINSYNLGVNFAKQLNKIYKPIINIKDVYTKDDFMFSEKLEVINKILAETIKKERSNPEPPKRNIFLKMLDRLFFEDDE
ncbi:hypothetical protein IJ596_04765 [bacterium]|nr:hypothetical protein [bacterium]